MNRMSSAASCCASCSERRTCISTSGRLSESLDQQIAHIRQADAGIVVVSSVPPSAVRHAIHVCKRLQAELPDVRVIVGLWSIEADGSRLRARLPEPLAHQLFTRLTQAVEWLRVAVAPGADAPMMPPPVPANEAARLDALRRTRLLDTPPEEAFDRVTRRLSEIFDAPISLMSLIDEDRQFWKSQHGLPAELAAAGAHARETSICGHVVAANETVVIEDAWLDPRMAGNSFLREQNIRFYAGAPLKTSDGSAIGSLCIIDHRPRRITAPRSPATRADGRYGDGGGGGARAGQRARRMGDIRARARGRPGSRVRGPDAVSASRAAGHRADSSDPSRVSG